MSQSALREGERRGRLTLLRLADERLDLDSRTRRRWLCRCDCGLECLVLEDNLLSGRSRSCGCRGRRGSSGTAPERLSSDLGLALRLARKKAGIRMTRRIVSLLAVVMRFPPQRPPDRPPGCR